MSVESLIEYLNRRASGYHRATVRYEGDNTDIIYLRDDVRETRLSSQIDRMLRRLRPEASPKEENAFPLGDLHATVRRFDEAIILHFPTGTDRGVVVSLDPDTARDLNTFLGECAKRIHG